MSVNDLNKQQLGNGESERILGCMAEVDQPVCVEVGQPK